MAHNLERNIVKYCIFKIFTKRVFLPLIAIFLVDHGGISLNDLALIASVTAIVQLGLEIPAGYAADRLGHKAILILGSALCAISVLPYIVAPGFIGGLVASVLFFGGASFTGGAIQAFMHETLLALGRHDEYSRIMGRAQSYGLLGNVLLVSLIPLTYGIHPRLPFILGFLCLAAACWLVISFAEPPKTPRATTPPKPSRISLRTSLTSLRQLPSLGRLLVTFLIFGIASAAFDQAGMFREVLFRDMGLPVESFGVILAMGSFTAAISGRYIHLLEKLSPEAFYLFDIVYLCLSYLLIGLTGSVVVTVLAFLMFPTYDRTRDIVFESRIFAEFPRSIYKSTMISLMNFSTLVNALWAPLLLSACVGQSTLATGYALFGALIGGALLLLLAVHRHTQKSG